MLTKASIEERKLTNNDQFFIGLLAPIHSEHSLRFTLGNLGRLPSDFSPKPLLNLLEAETVAKLRARSKTL